MSAVYNAFLFWRGEYYLSSKRCYAELFESFDHLPAVLSCSDSCACACSLFSYKLRRESLGYLTSYGLGLWIGHLTTRGVIVDGCGRPCYPIHLSTGIDDRGLSRGSLDVAPTEGSSMVAAGATRIIYLWGRSAESQVRLCKESCPPGLDSLDEELYLTSVR